MKKLTFQIAVIAFVAASISLASCSKEGPAGATGPAGPAGPGGAQGPKGDEGTANVIYSQWTDTVTYYLTTATTTDTIFGNLSVPDLTEDILNMGDMKVYVNFYTADDPYVVSLPYYTGNGGFIEAYFFIGGIEILSNLNIDGLPLRYVLIPGGSQASGRKSKPAVDWNDYNAVKKYLNLKD
jgi:hypothetical protein